MSVVVHVGQCGNQLADAFWRLAADVTDSFLDGDGNSALPSKKNVAAKPVRSELPMLYADWFFHRRSRRARCILVDTEPKAIRSILRSSNTKHNWCFEPAHVHYEQAGRGNNWAMGYNFQTYQRNVLPYKSSLTPAPLATTPVIKKKVLAAAAADCSDRRELVEHVMESLRQEIEALDAYRGTLLMHSLGGGTGAGLGCRLLETIRDVYPRSYLGAVSVAPSCASGDTPLQNYNALFTLQHLQEHTDCIIYKENDELLKSVQYWKGVVAAQARGGAPSPREEIDSKQVTLPEMNALAASDVAGLVFPVVRKYAMRNLVAIPFDMAKLVHDCCPLPTTKFLDTRTAVMRDGVLKARKTVGGTLDPLFHGLSTLPSSDDDSGVGVGSLLRHTMSSFPRCTNASRTIAASAVIRWSKGLLDECRSTEGSFSRSLSNGLPRLHLGNAVAVVHSSVGPFQSLGGKASATISLNNGHATASMSHFLDRGQRQFQAHAYTHWYRQYGLEDADFENAFEQCTRIVEDYNNILKP